ncbi:hypothetical protein C2S51_004303 [Perilla frutescens var. frutescens]|nr:hypothetical protein C2S51_004303 [Perilla frutescens var. frutescens]
MKYMDILQLLIFLVFLFSAVANSDHHCPISYCHNNTFPIKYPFRLQGQQTPNCNYTDLRCSSEGAVILDLPALGDFYVRDIHYGHGRPLILLYDPGNCLPNRFMSSNISSFHPGVAAHSLDYTFYSCPPHLISPSKFSAIGCLSNSSSTTVATRTVSSRIMTELYRCKEIATSSMPVAGRHPPDFIGNQNDFVLEWLASCESCPYEEQEWVSFHIVSMAAIVVSVAAIIMPAIICIGCCISLITTFRKELKVKRWMRKMNVQGPISEFILAIPTIVFLLMIIICCIGCSTHTREICKEIARPATSATTANATGLDDTRIKSCSELIVVQINENRGVLPGKCEKYSCSICLEEYSAKEKYLFVLKWYVHELEDRAKEKVVFICFACSTYTMDRYTREINNEVARRRIIARSSTPSTTLNAATSATTANATGLDDTKIKSCSELIVLDISESGRILPGQCEKYSCSICLEEYGAKEKVRQINLCQHRFHADCIDSWLQKNSTCPICRVSLLDEKL